MADIAEAHSVTSKSTNSAPDNDFRYPVRSEDRHDMPIDDVTSCEIAANIIAGMRGHNDEEEVKEELGCSPGDHCSVANMTIFQLLDN